MLDAELRFDVNEYGSSIADSLPQVRVLIANPRGFCAGVRRAIDAVSDALEHHGAPVYVRRPIVHNRAVVASLEAKGAVFVQELDEVPTGAVVVLSAHGVAPHVAAEARQRKLVTYDAVCPLVAKVHHEVKRHHRSGRHVILVGHEGHPEIVGTLGQVPEAEASLVRGAGMSGSWISPRDIRSATRSRRPTRSRRQARSPPPSCRGSPKPSALQEPTFVTQRRTDRRLSARLRLRSTR
jgi:hypothetical protein